MVEFRFGQRDDALQFVLKLPHVPRPPVQQQRASWRSFVAW
jgi:hypothetical protein